MKSEVFALFEFKPELIVSPPLLHPCLWSFPSALYLNNASSFQCLMHAEEAFIHVTRVLVNHMNEPYILKRQCETYLCFTLVVKREDVVSSACLALSDQEHSVTLRSRALNQIGCLDAGYGPVEPGVGKQEVICLLAYLLWQGKCDRTWNDEQINTIKSSNQSFWIIMNL